MKFKMHPRTTTIRDFRERMLDGTRGLNGAFKLSLGEAVIFWRKNFAKYHFEETAYSRYGGGVPRARYSFMRPVDPDSVVGTQNRKWEVIFRQRTGLTQASLKMRKQFWNRLQMNNRPMVYTGRTKEGILGGQFSVRGTSHAVRGSWNDFRINWQALAARGQELGQGLLFTSAAEAAAMEKFAGDVVFPYYTAMVEKGERLPAMSELPRKA